MESHIPKRDILIFLATTYHSINLGRWHRNTIGSRDRNIRVDYPVNEYLQV